MDPDVNRFYPKGFVEVYTLPDGTPAQLSLWKLMGHCIHSGPNQNVFSGIDLMVKLLSGEIDSYPGINGIYIEFENTADPASVVVPSVDTTKGVEYYRALSGQRDYLRVPALLYGKLSATDTRYRSNKAHYLGNSGGANGVNGLQFSAMAGSAVYGAALVHLGKTPADDIVYARHYMPAAKGVPAEQQVGMSWISSLHHKDDEP